MEEIHKLRAQLSSIAESNFQNAEVGFNKNIRPPNDTQVMVSCLRCSTFDDTILLAKSYSSTACRCLYRSSSSTERFNTKKRQRGEVFNC